MNGTGKAAEPESFVPLLERIRDILLRHEFPVERLGAGRAMDVESPPEKIGEAVEGLLASNELRAGAVRMADVVASYRGGAVAVEEVEALASPSEGPPRADHTYPGRISGVRAE